MSLGSRASTPHPHPREGDGCSPARQLGQGGEEHWGGVGLELVREAMELRRAPGHRLGNLSCLMCDELREGARSEREGS